MSKTNLKLSASRIKTFLGCSWLYFGKYHLKLPDTKNSGSIRGGAVHSIFEFLLKARHRKHYDSIIKAGSIYGSPAVLRLLKYYLKRDGLTEFDNKGEDNLKLVDEMVLVGLQTDFFCEGKKLEMGELEITINDPEYNLLGFIDKLAKDYNESSMTVMDYKSSKSEDDHTIQALTYALWVKKVLNLNHLVRILYLRFSEQDREKFTSGPFKDYVFTDSQLDGFEEYIKSLYKYLDGLTEEAAKRNMAFDKGFPGKNEGFCKRLMCGMGKTEGQLKKDGSLMYACSARWPFWYWVILQDGKVVESSKEELYPKDGQTVECRWYPGCPSGANRL